jgi:predicted glycoside hydrolase/deacetylase ChbG (UPF0249 family)
MPLACVVCADDFALTDGVSRAILGLLGSGHISATGAMTNRPGWQRWGRELVAFAGRADLGVHLNLTAGSPLTAMPCLAPDGQLPALGTVLRRACLSETVRKEIASEFAAQIACFSDVTGRAPDFVDGHQHVHALPGVAAVTLSLRQGDPTLARSYLRDPTDSALTIRLRGSATRKALLVAGLAAPFARRLRQAGIACNRGFSGFSAFDPAEDQLALLARQIVAPGRRHMVMCHPGSADDSELDGLDPVRETRPLETAALRDATSILRPVRFSVLQEPSAAFA